MILTLPKGTSASALSRKYVRTYKNQSPSPLTGPASLEMLKSRSYSESHCRQVVYSVHLRTVHSPAGFSQDEISAIIGITAEDRIAPLAQLDRASGYEPEGREFESLRARHLSRDFNSPWQ